MLPIEVVVDLVARGDQMSSGSGGGSEFVDMEVEDFRRRIENVRGEAEHLMDEFRVPDNDDWLIDPIEARALAQRIRITCAELLRQLDSLVSDAPAADRIGTAFVMVSTLKSLLDEIDEVEGRLRELSALLTMQGATRRSSPGLMAAAGRSLSWIGQHIKSVLKGALRSLWNLIAHLLTPKEWSVQGELGIGAGPFGLAKVTATITFGP
jgi:hypothetical protein